MFFLRERQMRGAQTNCRLLRHASALHFSDGENHFALEYRFCILTGGVFRLSSANYGFIR
jgi:hypothetical protein